MAEFDHDCDTPVPEDRTMAKKKRWVIRVILQKGETMAEKIAYGKIGTLLECLQYAGLVSELHPTTAISKVDDGNEWFDIYPPHGLDEQVWAHQNAMRMQTFGLNAVPAPRDR